MVRVRWLFLVLVLGCGGLRGAGGASETGGVHVSYPDAQQATAKLRKHFYAKPTAQCAYENGREAHWAITGARIDSGTLPNGVTIEDGAITGTPSKRGAFAAKIKVTGISCAGKPSPDEIVDVKVDVH